MLTYFSRPEGTLGFWLHFTLLARSNLKYSFTGSLTRFKFSWIYGVGFRIKQGLNIRYSMFDILSNWFFLNLLVVEV